MSKTTTGRRLLDDLEKRVSVIEGGKSADPMVAIKRELEEATAKLTDRIKSLDQRLNEVEASMAKNPPSDPSSVAKAKKKA